MMTRRAGELSVVDYERLMEPHRKAREQAMREEFRRETREDTLDSSTRTLAGLMDSHGRNCHWSTIG